MPMASGRIMKKRKDPTQAICFAPLVFFFALDIILTFIFGSFEANPTTTRGFDIDEEDSPNNWESPEPTWSITCDRSNFEYDLCYINRPLVLDPTASTIYAMDPTNSTPPTLERIRPYPGKWQVLKIMEAIKKLTLTTSPPDSPCAVSHTTPALLFSAGGNTTNYFRDFNEILVPLFITVDSFFTDRDVILAIVDSTDWWLSKYAALLRHFTRHPIITVDNQTASHCFPAAIVGLAYHGPMTVDPTLQRGSKPKTVLDFRAVLESLYGGPGRPPRAAGAIRRRPRLALMSRSRSRHRVILNEDEVRRAAEEVGFEVVVVEPSRSTPMEEVFRVIESSEAMVGVHGAGLTNEMFLREGTVVMQVVPIRNGWLGDICYGKLAIRLGLEYMVYDIGVEESSLASEYPKEKLDPNDQGGMFSAWSEWEIYMNQNVTLNLDRFTKYLEMVYEKAIFFMQKQKQKETTSFRNYLPVD